MGFSKPQKTLLHFDENKESKKRKILKIKSPVQVTHAPVTHVPVTHVPVTRDPVSLPDSVSNDNVDSVEEDLVIEEDYTV